MWSRAELEIHIGRNSIFPNWIRSNYPDEQLRGGRSTFNIRYCVPPPITRGSIATIIHIARHSVHPSPKSLCEHRLESARNRILTIGKIWRTLSEFSACICIFRSILHWFYMKYHYVHRICLPKERSRSHSFIISFSSFYSPVPFYKIHISVLKREYNSSLSQVLIRNIKALLSSTFSYTSTNAVTVLYLAKAD